MERETYNVPRHQKTPPPGARPASLAAPPGSQARVQVHIVEQIFDTFVLVPMLEVPVPQMVDQVVSVLKNFDMSSLVEQLIDVPRSRVSPTFSRRASCAAAGGAARGRATALLRLVRLCASRD